MFIGKLLLKILSNFVYVKNLNKNKSKEKNSFLICITIDAESGFVKKNEYRVWQKDRPDAFIGYIEGIKNWINLFSKYNIKSTFLLSTQFSSAKKETLEKIKNILKNSDKKGHEIGLHLHPDSDFALQKKLNKKLTKTSSKFYNRNMIKRMLNASKELIKKELGQKISEKIVSFRWGNWSLNNNAIWALEETGFRVDSSAVPGVKGHLNDFAIYDWSKINTIYPWYLNKNNYQITKGNSKVLEMPIATFNFFGLTLRADPIYSILLIKAFDYYYKNTDRSKKPFVFVVMSHSSEGTYANGKPTKVIGDMELFIKHSQKYKQVRFVTLKEAYKYYIK